MAKPENDSVLDRIVRRLLQPVARFALKRGFSFQQFIACARLVFVDAAQKELELASEKVNVSRVSVLTGLSRREVQRIFENAPLPSDQQGSLIARILGQWEYHKKYSNRNGPRSLTCEGEKSEFWRLCQSLSKNINPGTILFELERTGVIERKGGSARLLRSAAVLRKNEERGYELLANDIDAMILAAERNLSSERPEDITLHYHTEYDQIRRSAVNEIRAKVLEEGKEFHRKIREYLSGFDMDINPLPTDSTELPARVVVGSYGIDVVPPPRKS